MTITTVLAIDPGPTESAYVLFDGERVLGFDKLMNENILLICDRYCLPTRQLVIEQVACMGMPAGAELFETVFWSGRFAEAWTGEWDRMKRHEVKSHLCHHPRARDGNIRQALIDRWGGKDKAIGRNASPGPLYGISGDVWQALALAVTYWDLRVTPNPRGDA